MTLTLRGRAAKLAGMTGALLAALTVSPVGANAAVTDIVLVGSSPQSSDATSLATGSKGGGRAKAYKQKAHTRSKGCNKLHAPVSVLAPDQFAPGGSSAPAASTGLRGVSSNVPVRIGSAGGGGGSGQVQESHQNP